jgi:hypothetical protein
LPSFSGSCWLARPKPSATLCGPSCSAGIAATRHGSWPLSAWRYPHCGTSPAGSRAGFGGELEELDAEILAGFLAHVAIVRVELPEM